MHKVEVLSLVEKWIAMRPFISIGLKISDTFPILADL